MFPERGPLIDAFLEAHGWGGAIRRPLAGDASFRRYERIADGRRRAVLMDAPPPMEDVRPFVAIARHLAALGFSAPEILAEDAEAGLLLLEDLGDDTYTRRLAQGGDEEALYALAVDVLIDLHGRPAAEAMPPGLAPYGNGRLLDEAFLCVQWTYPAVAGETADEDLRRAYGDAWLELFGHVHALEKTLVLRDYHVDNLLWLPDREGVRACGLLDFQDAVAGAPAYDLMSLLQDARRDLSPGLEERMMDRYRQGMERRGKAPDRAAFDLAYAILAAQRHAKVIGIFTRLAARDGKPDYLIHIPRVWRRLEAALVHPRLAALRDWFDRHMPAPMRVIPPFGPPAPSAAGDGT